MRVYRMTPNDLEQANDKHILVGATPIHAKLVTLQKELDQSKVPRHLQTDCPIHGYSTSS